MSYVVKTVTVKGSTSTQWFGAANADIVTRIDTWMRTQPGFISQDVRSVTPTEVHIITIFDSKANYDAFRTAQANNADCLARKAFNEQNQIVSSSSVIV